jgi:hypothetical protein
LVDPFLILTLDFFLPLFTYVIRNEIRSQESWDNLENVKKRAVGLPLKCIDQVKGDLIDGLASSDEDKVTA